MRLLCVPSLTDENRHAHPNLGARCQKFDFRQPVILVGQFEASHSTGSGYGALRQSSGPTAGAKANPKNAGKNCDLHHKSAYFVLWGLAALVRADAESCPWALVRSVSFLRLGT